MATIKDYSTLTTAIGNWTHRADLIAGSPPPSDDFIQAAQEQFEKDLLDQNFGNGIRRQEAAYGPYTFVNGMTPVPSDWLAPKFFTVTDGTFENTLDFKSAAWLYAIYSQRTADNVPAYVARDTGATSFVPLQTQVAEAGQTVFNVTIPNTQAVWVALGGVSLYAGIDYIYANGVLTLFYGALAGQTLLVQPLMAAYTSQSFTATAGQTAFTLKSTPTTALLVTLNGVVLYSGTDYGIVGTTLTLTHGAVVGETLYVAALDSGMSVQTQSAGTAQKAFLLTGSAVDVLLVALGGVLLVAGEDYSITGNYLVLSRTASGGEMLGVWYGTSTQSTGVFVFGPYPDSNYIVAGTYYQTATLLSYGGNTTNWMSQHAPMVLLHYCLWQAALFLKDSAKAQEWLTLAQAGCKGLVDKDKAERWSATTLQIETA